VWVKPAKLPSPPADCNSIDYQERRSLSGNRPQTRIPCGRINYPVRLAHLSLGPIKAEPGNIYDGRTEYVSLGEADHLTSSEYLVDYVVQRIGNQLRSSVKEVGAIEAILC